jgi:hypothetical protein
MIVMLPVQNGPISRVIVCMGMCIRPRSALSCACLPFGPPLSCMQGDGVESQRWDVGMMIPSARSPESGDRYPEEYTYSTGEPERRWWRGARSPTSFERCYHADPTCSRLGRSSGRPSSVRSEGLEAGRLGEPHVRAPGPKGITSEWLGQWTYLRSSHGAQETPSHQTPDHSLTTSMLPSTVFDEKEILPGADGTDRAVATQDDSRALIDAAIAVAEYEKTLSFSQIFKLYWKGAVWSIVLSLALIMEGMDTGLVSSVL